MDEFIEISKQGKADGAFIQHRENGTVVELNPDLQRAVGKMKATITQRFRGQDGAGRPVVYDVDCDCRFLFFCLRDASHGGQWRAKFVKLIYEKDRLCPVDGKTMPVLPAAELAKYPEGYKYLGASQASLGHEVHRHLATLDERCWGRMYSCMESWLEGDDDAGLFWDVPERSRL